MEAPMTQRRQGGGIVNFLVGLVCVAMFVAFSLLIADRLGYLPAAQGPAPVAPAPTPIIRVVAPRPPAQSAPVGQPAQPAVVAPAVEQPVVAPLPVEQPTMAPVRQIIIIKQADNPAAAPIVIDRGTKRRSP